MQTEVANVDCVKAISNHFLNLKGYLFVEYLSCGQHLHLRFAT